VDRATGIPTPSSSGRVPDSHSEGIEDAQGQGIEVSLPMDLLEGLPRSFLRDLERSGHVRGGQLVRGSTHEKIQGSDELPAAVLSMPALAQEEYGNGIGT